MKQETKNNNVETETKVETVETVETETQETETQETETETSKKKEKTIGFNLFEMRYRYPWYKDKDGNKQQYKSKDKDNNISSYKYIERIYIGRLASNVSFASDMIKQGKIKPDSIVYIYCIGNTCDIEKYQEKDDMRLVEKAKVNNNVVFLYDKDNNIIYSNNHNNASDMQAVDFFASETKAKVEKIELPFVETKKQETVKDIASLIKQATEKEKETSDLQF